VGIERHEKFSSGHRVGACLPALAIGDVLSRLLMEHGPCIRRLLLGVQGRPRAKAVKDRL